MTLQLVHLMSKNKKVLCLSSDLQNNILLFAGINLKNNEKGIENWLSENKGDFTKLRDNLYYISINAPSIPRSLHHKFQKFIEIAKEKFDYIFIDASPVMDLDMEFMNVADAVVIPTFLEAVSSQAITKMFNTVDVKKIKAIIPNRTSLRNKLKKEYYQKLANDLAKTGILLTCPLQQCAIISQLIDKGKIVYEVNNVKVAPFKKEFLQVMEVIK